MEGYGLYFYCLELIVGNIEAHNITFQLEHDAEIIAHKTGLHVDHVQDMMTYMVELGLFENTAGNITCFKIVKRLDSSMTSNPRLREMIKQFHENHDGVMTQSGQSHDSVMLEEKRREEKIGRHDAKSSKRTRFKKPTVVEVASYCNDRGNSVDPERFIDHYTANGWKVGKNPMKDWKAAVRTWEKNQPQTEEARQCL